ncbi:hypothetical protein JCM16303_003953 [Sporobolomyces ruberrimus]
MAPSLPHLHHDHHHHQQQEPSSQTFSPPSTSTASTSKGQHYAQTLDQARRLSLFANKFPAELKTGNINRSSSNATAGMDWSELLRKFRKHNPQRTLTASTAQTDQILHSLLLETRAPPELSIQSASHLPPLPPILSSESHQSTALTSLSSLESTLHSSTNQSNDVELTSAKIVVGFGKYLVGDFQESLRVLDGAGGKINLETPRSEFELYDLTLRVLGNAVRGFCLERLEYPLNDAREAYKVASRIYEQSVETISKSTKTLGAKEDVSLHRIGETVLWRLCHIDQNISSPHQAYTSHLSYIRQSSLYHSSLPSSSLTSPLSPYSPSRSLSIHSQFHLLSLRTQNHLNSSVTNKAQESLLRRTTSLPKAGEVNKEYLRFLDQVVERWRDGGSRVVEANEVIEILYNALTHTFQSHRLLRYLVRSLTIAERYEEAGKALNLYVELWDKARETDAKRVAQEMKRLRKRAGVDTPKRNGEKSSEKSGLRIEGQEREEEEEEEEEHDIDSDREFIETAAFGVRLLCRYLKKPDEAVTIAKRMQEIRESGKERGLKEDQEVRGKVELALGISLGALAHEEADPETRPAQHASSLAHLELASTLLPTSFHALYHHSYQLFELRQISRAFEVAKEAVSIEKRNKRGWHLLGLILTAMKDMKGALQVFETALDFDQDQEEDEGGDTLDALAKLEGTAKPSMKNKVVEQERWDCPITETEKLEQDVQLRLSKNTVIEYLEGPASALEDQQEILAWFSRAYAPIAEAMLTAPPPPVPSTHLEALSGSTNLSKRKSLLGRRVSLRSKRDTSGPPSVPPPSATTLSPPPGLSPPSASPSPYASVNPSRNPSTIDLSHQRPRSTLNGASLSKPNVSTNPRATKLLVDVWLASAASFRRAGKLEESKGAIWEAEQLDADDPDVWSNLAAVHIAKGEIKAARSALQKAFSFEIDHLPSLILFSRLYLTPPPSTPSPQSEPTLSWIHTQLPFAEALLETLTKQRGWDCPEAWFELSRCYKLTDRRDKEKECLVWALQLEETRSLRGLGKALERIL